MRDAINSALKEAIKAQDKRRMATLRLISAAIKDRDIASSDEKVSDAEVLEIMAKMIKQRREAVTTYEEAGRLELARQEQEEIEIIESFLPAQLGEAATEAAVDEVIAELGSEGLKDMGRTMGELKKRYAGRMDFAKASSIVKDRLS